jgi:protein-L-isoaspartate(D-aspartate) O-methyltransferase
MLTFARARKRMVDDQIARRGVCDQSVLDAMRCVPREAFVQLDMEEYAYEDWPLPIGEGQTISQPYIVARMIEAAEIKPGHRVLEVGAGSGYAAAILSRIAEHVYAIERHHSLGAAARERWSRLGYGNITLRVGDGTQGWPEAAPFDAIMVSAGSPKVPQALKRQLAVGGRLVIPVDENARGQTLLKITRRSETDYEKEELGAVAFVPLVSEQGWAEDGQRSASIHVSGGSKSTHVDAIRPAIGTPSPLTQDAVHGHAALPTASKPSCLTGTAENRTPIRFLLAEAIDHLIASGVRIMITGQAGALQYTIMGEPVSEGDIVTQAFAKGMPGHGEFGGTLYGGEE